MRPRLNKVCGLWWCNHPHYAFGLCERHYLSLRRYGGYLPPSQVDTKYLLQVCNDLAESMLEILSKLDVYEDEPCPFCRRIVKNGHEETCPIQRSSLLAQIIATGNKGYVPKQS